MLVAHQSSWRILLVALLCVVFTMKLGCILWARPVLDSLRVENLLQHGQGVLGDTSDHDPQWNIGSESLPSVRMSIENTVHYQLNDSSSDAEWDALSPRKGLVYLGPNRRAFTPSIFHQLRCLNLIRKSIVELVALGGDHPEYPSDLTEHCVGYLRQMVLCRADADIDVVLGGTNPTVHPNAYECRDWNAIYDMVERNHSDEY
ncbi:hypothetical protein OF83DRAFT_768468 [Amylostereum chailletii]|nr:hypothetical protein OF83DRAFT_768468 [Amylostereum chailletii]